MMHSFEAQRAVIWIAVYSEGCRVEGVKLYLAGGSTERSSYLRTPKFAQSLDMSASSPC
jgi:hypothetical protein